MEKTKRQTVRKRSCMAAFNVGNVLEKTRGMLPGSPAPRQLRRRLEHLQTGAKLSTAMQHLLSLLMLIEAEAMVLMVLRRLVTAGDGGEVR